MNRWWNRVLALSAALLVLLAALPAGADEPAPEQELDFAQRVDKFVGDWPNYYLGKILFFDVVFWDDQLPAGEGVGTVVGDERITGYRDGAGYVYQRQLSLTEPVLHLEGPQERTFGSVKVELRPGTRRDPDGDKPIIVGAVVAQDVDLAASRLEPAPAEATDEEAIVPVTGLAPFAVRVDRRTAQVVPIEIVMRPDMIPVSVGDRVDTTSGVAVLESKGADGVWAALAQTERIDPERLKNPDQAAMPAVVLWLVIGSVFFTLRMSFVNLWGVVHAVRVTMGTYDNPEDEGEITHFQALSSALSATVGLGNIAGVAIAITMGGPGAIFWMMVAGFLGMTSKFTECTLGQMYRQVRPDGTVSGGPMHYLRDGLAEIGLGPLGTVCAWMFAVMCVGGSFGGGNMFQANQSLTQVSIATGGALDTANPFHRLVYGLFLAGLVGAVIIGGIKRIGAAASMIVPLMCVVYVVAGLVIVVVNASHVPGAIVAIVSQAFTPEAGFGGMLGVLAQGFKRASFSSEAGVGSASIAHSAAQTPYPVREGIVALLEPFIDTIIVCATTGIVVVVTGVYTDPSVGNGVAITSAAFDSVLPGFRYILTFAVFLFAFSTMISWSYYGERCATWMLGERVRMTYRMVFLVFIVLGCLADVANVTDFSDMMILGMAFPNILGAVLLSGKVKAALDDYWGKLKSGAFDAARA